MEKGFILGQLHPCLDIISSYLTMGVNQLEEIRGPLFGLVCMLKYKIDTMKNKGEDKVIHLDLNCMPNDKKDIKLFVNLLIGEGYSYPFTTCPSQVINSLASITMTVTAKDKAEFEQQNQKINELLAAIKSSKPQYPGQEVAESDANMSNYDIFSYNEELKSHVIISFKIEETKKELIQKIKDVFPIDKYFLSLLFKLGFETGVNFDELLAEDNEKILQTTMKEHFSLDLTVKKTKIIKDLYDAYCKIEKQLSKMDSPQEQKKGNWDFNHIILLLEILQSMKFDVNLLPTIRSLTEIMETELTYLIPAFTFINKGVKGGIFNQMMDLIPNNDRTYEINLFCPMLMTRLEINGELKELKSSESKKWY